MKWPSDYSQRLQCWHALRAGLSGHDIQHDLLAINDWWFDLPWRAYSLHWDDWRDWPDPWQLLQENQFCDLARALGMLYTLHLCDIASTVQLAQASDRHLVLVDQGKYVLNWNPGGLVNITSHKIAITKTLASVALPQLMSKI